MILDGIKHWMILNPFAKDTLKFETFYDLIFIATPSPSTISPPSPLEKGKRKPLVYKSYFCLSSPLNILGAFNWLVDLMIYSYVFLLLRLKTAVSYPAKVSEKEMGKIKI